MINPKDNLVKGATPRPGDFPLGSAQSRAAARVLAEQQARSDLEGRHKIVIVTNVPRIGAEETFLDESGETIYRKTVYGNKITR